MRPIINRQMGTLQEKSMLNVRKTFEDEDRPFGVAQGLAASLRTRTSKKDATYFHRIL